MKRSSISIAAPTSLPLDVPAVRFGAVMEAMRYLLVSAAALAIDFGLLLFFTRLGVAYPVAAIIGFAAGLIVAYAGSVHWAFGRRTVTNQQAEFVVFATIGVFGLCLNEAILVGCVAWLGISVAIAKLVSAGFVFCCNFGLRKKLLFTAGAS